MSNPNIGEISKGKSTGPRTEEGKLVIEAYHNKGKSLENKFKKAGLSMAAYKAFCFFVRAKQTKGLQEINRLENVIYLLETDLSIRAMDKIEKGLPLNSNDLKQIRLLKESIVDLHKIKYGEKRLNVHASYQDIQKMMFEQGQEPGPGAGRNREEMKKAYASEATGVKNKNES